MPSDTYILTISESGVSVPSSHGSTHTSTGSDPIPTATSSASGLMSASIFNQHVANTAKVSNVTHTGDVTDTAGVLTVNKINGVTMSGLATGIVKNTTGTGAPSIAVASDFPTLNQNTTGNAATATFASTATLATTATNIAGGSVGSVPYQTGFGTTALLGAGTAGFVLKSNGSAAPSWAPVDLSAGISGSLPVSSGGTGAATFTAGVLKANGTSSFTTVTAPTGALVGTTDSQTLTNKTFGTGTTFSSAVGVASGGTGAATFTAGVLKANGTSSFTTVTAPTGDIVGTTDTQTLTNKTLGSGTVFNTTISATSGGTGQSSYTVGDILFADTVSTLSKLSGAATGNALISGGVGATPSYGKIGLTTHISGTLPVVNGGTGVATLTGYVKGTGTTAMTASATIPTSDLSGTISVANGGTGAATLTGYVKGTGTTAMTASATVPVADISGTLPVANGGTGVTTSTGTGSTVRSTSPTLVTPLLGTPTSGTLSNCTGLPLTTGVTGTLPVANGGTANDGTAITALTFDTLKFKTTDQSSNALSEGQLRWNSIDKTLDLRMSGTSVIQQVGQAVLMFVTASQNITKGQVVYIDGSFDGVPEVGLASNDSTSSELVVGVAAENINFGQNGYIIVSGLLRGLNLTGYGIGQEVWLSSNGNITAIEPSYPLYKVRVGYVSHVDATTGVIQVDLKYFENGLVNGAGKIGYTSGSGGTVTQLTSKSTGVTLNKINGQITTNVASLAGGDNVTFTLTNSRIESGDIIIMNHHSGGTLGNYNLSARTNSGSATINIRNLTNSALTDAIVISFVVIKSVNS